MAWEGLGCTFPPLLSLATTAILYHHKHHHTVAHTASLRLLAAIILLMPPLFFHQHQELPIINNRWSLVKKRFERTRSTMMAVGTMSSMIQ
mmetsp:Transcript_11740/g.19949  ORF Transcript_11740/g.19949 Transcript_11740/m.19949 type:complete len:91 (+) Transcript_11740:368-640(+)